MKNNDEEYHEVLKIEDEKVNAEKESDEMNEDENFLPFAHFVNEFSDISLTQLKNFPFSSLLIK